jgi:hypothetical protein
MRGMYAVIYSHHVKLCCGGFSFTIRRMTAVPRMSELTQSEILFAWFSHDDIKMRESVGL